MRPKFPLENHKQFNRLVDEVSDIERRRRDAVFELLQRYATQTEPHSADTAKGLSDMVIEFGLLMPGLAYPVYQKMVERYGTTERSFDDFVETYLKASLFFPSEAMRRDFLVALVEAVQEHCPEEYGSGSQKNLNLVHA